MHDYRKSVKLGQFTSVYIRPFAIISSLSEKHFTDNNKIT